ncbi:MAG: hypothetical protein ABW032_06975 [Burkholderiaceae bacterium]
MTARSALLVVAALLSLGGASAFAQQEAALGKAPAAARPPETDGGAPGLVQPAPPTKAKDARIEHLVTEDSQVRIEETRVRGVTERIVVHSKIPGMGSYEIQPKNPGVGPENDHGAGMRLFNFGF